jgi:hypothetical protein
MSTSRASVRVSWYSSGSTRASASSHGALQVLPELQPGSNGALQVLPKLQLGLMVLFRYFQSFSQGLQVFLEHPP